MFRVSFRSFRVSSNKNSKILLIVIYYINAYAREHVAIKYSQRQQKYEKDSPKNEQFNDRELVQCAFFFQYSHSCESRYRCHHCRDEEEEALEEFEDELFPSIESEQ